MHRPPSLARLTCCPLLTAQREARLTPVRVRCMVCRASTKYGDQLNLVPSDQYRSAHLHRPIPPPGSDF